MGHGWIRHSGEPGAARRRGAFTLVEVLVAVGALALLAVGVALIFDATGRTVAGGKRAAAINAYAALLEQRLRADVAAMTGDGFIVIRNEYVDANADGVVDPFDLSPTNPDAVGLSEGDRRPRVRRVDELMFFARGEYASARPPLHAAMVPRGDSARIYYGHGKRRIAPTGTNPNPRHPYLWPELDDAGVLPGDERNAAFGYVPGGGVINPNRWAGDWTLLRHVTVLCPVQTTPRSVPPDLPPWIPQGALYDSDIQVALQPAASNIFRALTQRYPQVMPVGVIRSEAQHPVFTSGIVDIATTDLAEIRAVVMTADVFPHDADERFFHPQWNSGSDGSNAGVDGQFRPPPRDRDVLRRVQAWMTDALPADSHAATNARDRQRIRYEPASPNYVGVLADAGLSTLQRESRRGDQIMLAASNFLPRCSEFIVEWSFGKTFPDDPNDPNYVPGRAGQLIWHGAWRESLEGGSPVVVAAPYDDADPLVRVSTRYTRVDGTSVARLVTTKLIHGDEIVLTTLSPGTPLMSFFGYVDPTFNPDSNDNGRLDDSGDAREPTLAWPWPRLLRITLSLADPAEPSVEQTFQYVIEVPPRR